MASQILAIGAILLSTIFLLMGNGLLGTLTPIRAHLENFSDIEIGVMGSFYFAGFVLGCAAGPRLLARIGHIRTFAVAAALTAAVVLVQPIYPDPVVWYVVRAGFGFCAAILFMTIESWLNDRATNETRGRILSTYVVVNLTALTAGQWLLLAAPPEGYELFSLAAIVYACCLVPVGVTRLPAPEPVPAPTLRLRRLAAISPVGVAGVATVGLANGAFWTLSPVYAQSLGFDTGGVALFMTVVILGGAFVQFPLGRFSDRMDRRWVIAAVSAVACAAGILLALAGIGVSALPWLFYPLVGLFGAAMLPLYSLSIAHANDRLPREEFVEASAGLLLINALASIAGPVIAAVVISFAGNSALFAYTAIFHAAMAAFAILRIRVHQRPSEDTREPFELLPAQPQSSPGVLPLDPRGPEQDERPGEAVA